MTVEETVNKILTDNNNKCPCCGAELRSNISMDAENGSTVLSAEVYCSDTLGCGEVLMRYKNNKTRASYDENRSTFIVNGKEVTRKEYETWTGKVLDRLYNAANAKKTCQQITEELAQEGLPDWWFTAAEDLLGATFMPF